MIKKLLIISLCMLQLSSCKYESSYPPKDPNKVRIACVGNSITEGFLLINPELESYPSQLQGMLGGEYEVLNFGASAMTVMNTHLAYTKTVAYKEALACNPDIVTIMLGTNDCFADFRDKIETSFIEDYTKIIRSFQKLKSKPKIILVLPAASFITDETKPTNGAIVEYILPRIRKIAEEENLELIDCHSPTLEHEDLFPDQLHPNPKGMRIIALTFEKAIKANN